MIRYYEDLIRIITNSMESIDEKNYNDLVNQCVATVQKGGKIIASGLGKNVPICEKFVGTLNSFGVDARFLHTNTAVHGDLGMVNKEDLVIVLSKGGNTIETVQLIQYLLERGTNTWLLSFAKTGKSAELLPPEKILMVELEHEGDQWNIVPNNSTTVNLIILQGVAIEMSKRLGITIEDFKVNHPGGGIGASLRGEQIWKN